MSYSSELIAVVGPTGGGKSTSIEKLDASTTFVINIMNKPLPFRGWMRKYKPFSTETEEGLKGNMYTTKSWQKIIDLMNYVNDIRKEIKVLLIDDFQYIMADEFMQRGAEKGWDKFTEMGKHVYDILIKGAQLRGDLKVIILTHDDIVKQGVNERRKIKTIGNMLDDKVTLEGMFTYVLFTHSEKAAGKDHADYYFITNTDGYTTAKSPKGALPYKIPNDLSIVIKAIDDYKNGVEES